MAIAVWAVFLITSPCWAFGGGGGGAEVINPSFVLLTPDPPRNVTATAGNGMATVCFTPPKSDGGNPVTVYTVMSHPWGIKAKGTKSPVTVKGLRTDKPTHLR